MGRPGECGEAHGISLEHESAAPPVGHLRPADADLVSTFLGNHVAGYIVHHLIPVDPQLRAFAAVRVGLGRTHSIPFHMVIVGIHFQNHAEFRHIAQLLHRIIGQSGLDRAVPEDRIGNRTGGYRPGGEMIEEGHSYGAFVFFHNHILELIGLQVLVSDIETCQLPLPVLRHQLAALVIVYRRPPKIRLRNGLQHFHAAPAVGGQSAE